MKVVHAYFAHSSIKYCEFHSLAFLMEMKELKLLKNVCTRWCSLIRPLRLVLIKYPTFMAKMFTNKDDRKWSGKANVDSYHSRLSLICTFIFYDASSSCQVDWLIYFFLLDLIARFRVSNCHILHVNRGNQLL